jgi:putative thiamine transport system permease protein
LPFRSIAARRLNPGQIIAHLLIGLPTLGGLAVTLAAAFGYLPALGGATLGLDAWRRLFAEPGLMATLGLTLRVGFAATALSLALALALLAASSSRRLDPLLAPLIASPHSAVAVGLAFLIAPSGWIVRLLSPWASGWTMPPDIAIVGDPAGLSLTLGLVLKETPFLTAVGLAALRQFPARAQMQAARSLGYAPATAFALVVAPQLYPRIRLPVFAVLAYSLSVVDMALVLAPSHPAPLSLLALRWLESPQLDDVFPGEAAAALQFGLVVAGFALWRVGEVLAGGWVRSRVGRRWGWPAVAIPALSALGAALLALGLASLLGLAVWSFAWRWPFPAALPESWSLDLAGRQMSRLSGPLGATVALALTTSAASLALAVVWLESEDRLGRRAAPSVIVLPLLAPQIAFLFGTQTLFAWARIDGSFAAVAWAQSLFVFPYVWLALADPWRALDSRYARAAAALGAGPMRRLVAVKLPILLAPLALAFAIGVAVSVAQYLATLFAGGGRVATLTTEALALAGGGDRRLSAMLGLVQAVAPLAVYGAAFALPRIAFGQRRGLA